MPFKKGIYLACKQMAREHIRNPSIHFEGTFKEWICYNVEVMEKEAANNRFEEAAAFRDAIKEYLEELTHEPISQ